MTKAIFVHQLKPGFKLSTGETVTAITLTTAHDNCKVSVTHLNGKASSQNLNKDAIIKVEE